MTMAETFSVERRRLMRFLGAKVVLTPAAERGMGMVNKAVELAKTHGWFLTRQFENEANADMHSRTTAREIIDDFAGEQLDYWVTGFGTGGTLKGVARVLAKERPDTKIVVCEPEDAPMLSSGEPQARKPDGSPAAAHAAFKPHPMQGWSARLHPEADRRRGRLRHDPQDHRIAGPDALRCSRSWRRRKASSSASPPAPPSPARCKSAPRRRKARPSWHAARYRRALSQHAALRRIPADMTEEELEISRSTPAAQMPPPAGGVIVMAGPVPAIHVFLICSEQTWMTGAKPGHSGRARRLPRGCAGGSGPTRTSILPKLRPPR